VPRLFRCVFAATFLLATAGPAHALAVYGEGLQLTAGASGSASAPPRMLVNARDVRAAAARIEPFEPAGPPTP